MHSSRYEITVWIIQREKKWAKIYLVGSLLELSGEAILMSIHKICLDATIFFFWILPLSGCITKTRYSNILKILQPKKENFQINCSDIFHIPAQNIDCGCSLELSQWGSSNEYQQSMLFSKIRKIMYTPKNPSFTIKKWGFRGSKLYSCVFVMVCHTLPY